MTRSGYITALCDALDRINRPNPLNPAGISDLAYSRAITGWIVCKWKQSGMYTLSDSINGKVYKSQNIAESVQGRYYPYLQYQYVIRSV